MDNASSAVLKAFGGIINWGTVLVIVAGVLSYVVLSFLARILDKKELSISLFGNLAVCLGTFHNAWARGAAKSLWRRVMNLEHRRQTILAKDPCNREEERCSAIRSLSQVSGGDAVAQARYAIGQTLNDSHASDSMRRLGEAAMKELPKGELHRSEHRRSIGARGPRT